MAVRIKSFLVVLVSALLTGTVASAATLRNAMMTRSIPPQGQCTPLPSETSTFSTTDAEAYLFFSLEGAQAGDVASSQWQDPSGKVYSVSGETGGPWQPLSSGGNWCLTERLAIAGKPPASLPGTWTVQVTWNGAALFTLRFTIAGTTGTGGNLRVSITQVNTAACPTVKLSVSVIDSQGRSVVGLTGSNFTLKEDGQVRPITVTMTTSGSGLSVVLLMDTSGSQSERDKLNQAAAAKALVDQLPADAAMAVYFFSTSVNLVRNFSTDKAAIKAAIDQISMTTGGETSIYDAVLEGAVALGARPGRRAIVLMTDGKDTASQRPVGTAILQAQQSSATVYTVGFGDQRDDATLTRIARETGGFYSPAASSDDLQRILQGLGQTLATAQYEITYTSANPAADHSIELSVAISGGSSGVTTRSVSACSSSGTTPGGVILTIENASGTPGQSVDVPLSLKASGQRPASFQLDVSYDTQLLTFSAARRGEQLTNSGKDVSTSALGTGKFRLIGAGLNQNVIGDGTVALMNFTLNPAFPPNSKTTLACSNPLSVDPQSKALPTTCVAGTVTSTASCSCDVNADGAVNVGDVQLMINQALGKVAATCDLNGDGKIDVQDVQIVINAALGQGCRR